MRTTLDPRLQTAARIALMDGLETYDHRHGWRGAWGHVDIEPGWEERGPGRQPPPSERRTGGAAVVTDVPAARCRVQIADDGSVGEIVPARRRLGQGRQGPAASAT